MKSRIYLDNSATTQVAEEVLEAMIPFMFFNDTATTEIYTFGQEAISLPPALSIRQFSRPVRRLKRLVRK
jgi:selenocysteine lyase/cysteine desulfurase